MVMLESLKITLKDVISLVVYISSAAMFFSSQSNKIDILTETIKELKATAKENSADNKSVLQAIQLKVTDNTSDIKLLQQDIEMIKNGYYKNREWK